MSIDVPIVIMFKLLMTRVCTDVVLSVHGSPENVGYVDAKNDSCLSLIIILFLLSRIS